LPLHSFEGGQDHRSLSMSEAPVSPEACLPYYRGWAADLSLLCWFRIRRSFGTIQSPLAGFTRQSQYRKSKRLRESG
jgi:hypothetical protein